MAYTTQSIARAVKTIQWPRFCPGPRWGAYSAPPDSLAGEEGAVVNFFKNPTQGLNPSGFGCHFSWKGP